MVLLGLALAPVVFIASYIYLKDKYDREPLKHLFVSFILGALSTFPAAIIEFSLGSYFPENRMHIPTTIIHAFLIVALTEEFVKWFVLKFYAYRQKEFNEPFDGIVYGVIVSLGFAALENIIYVYQGGFHVALLRMFTAVPAHASFGVMMGYYFGLAWMHKDKAWQYKLRGLIIATVLHGIYDFFLFQENYPAFMFFSFLGLIISIRLSRKAIIKHQLASPFHPNNKTDNDNNFV